MLPGMNITQQLPHGEVVWSGPYAGRMLRIVKDGGMLTSEFCRKDALRNEAWFKTRNQEYAPFYIHVVKDLLNKKTPEAAFHDVVKSVFGALYPHPLDPAYPCNG
jgi:hypothetical protein